MQLMESHGADAVRWFFAASGSPWSTRKISDGALSEIVRKVLLTYWNTASFLVLYAGAAAGHDPNAAPPAPPVAARPALDRWLLSELNALVRDVTATLEAFDSAAAGRLLTAFIDALSNWYVRRSRRRFWDGPATPDGAAAFATLTTTLDTLTRLLAPITPFITDCVWRAIRDEQDPESVHLAAWPQADLSLIDATLAEQMNLVRRLVELGRSARATAVVKTRQPLSRALIAAPGLESLPAELAGQIADELNVKELAPLERDGSELVHYLVKPNFRSLGKRFGSGTQQVAAAIATTDAANLAAALAATGAADLDVDGTTVRIGPSDVTVTQVPAAGWAVAADGGETVALAVTVTEELRREGLAREFVRLVQDARKGDGLEVTDRIALWWRSGNQELIAALHEHQAMIAAEVLAVEFGPLEAGDAGASAGEADTAEAERTGLPVHRHDNPELGVSFWLGSAAMA
jgi:isoleucyl-tRNA synthetase